MNYVDTHWLRQICRRRGAKPVSGSRSPARSSFIDWHKDKTSAHDTNSVSAISLMLSQRPGRVQSGWVDDELLDGIARNI